MTAKITAPDMAPMTSYCRNRKHAKCSGLACECQCHAQTEAEAQAEALPGYDTPEAEELAIEAAGGMDPSLPVEPERNQEQAAYDYERGDFGDTSLGGTPSLPVDEPETTPEADAEAAANEAPSNRPGDLADTAPEFRVTVVGPNGVDQLEVHAEGCSDLSRPKYGRSEKTTETTVSLHDLTESWYTDQIEESDATWEDYTGEFKVFPCTGHLPYDHEVTTDAAKLVADRLDPAKAPAPAPAPAKPAKAKSKGTVAGKLSNGQKRVIRVQMARHLEAMVADLSGELEGVTAQEVAEYVDFAWTKYIDPDRERGKVQK